MPASASWESPPGVSVLPGNSPQHLSINQCRPVRKTPEEITRIEYAAANGARPTPVCVSATDAISDKHFDKDVSVSKHVQNCEVRSLCIFAIIHVYLRLCARLCISVSVDACTQMWQQVRGEIKSILTQWLYLLRPNTLFNPAGVALLVRLFLVLISKQTALKMRWRSSSPFKVTRLSCRDFPLWPWLPCSELRWHRKKAKNKKFM